MRKVQGRDVSKKATRTTSKKSSKAPARPRKAKAGTLLVEYGPRATDKADQVGESLAAAYFDGLLVHEAPVPRKPRGLGVHRDDYAHILEATPEGRRVLEILTSVFPTEAGMVQWLRQPHADLGGRTPFEVVTMGYAGAVESMLEAALIGLPS